MIGSDPDQVEQLAQQMGASARRLDAIRSTIRAQLHSTPWFGPDADNIRRDWDARYSLVLTSAAHLLTAAQSRLHGEARQQIEASSGLAAMASMAPAMLVPSCPDPGASASASAAWWAGLSEEGRRWVLKNHPEWVGNLDGIPAAVRSEANLARLNRMLSQAQADYLEYKDKGDKALGLFTNDDRRAELALERVNALKAIKETMKDADRQLLLLDINEQDKVMAAVACGNVDTAANVAVFTGGVGTDVATDLRGKVNDMENLRQASGGGSTATVAWIGYEAPPDLLADGSLVEKGGRLVGQALAASSDADDLNKAKVGADKLAEFLSGIRETNVNANLTAIGHSYGSTTTALALQQLEPGVVDNAVFVGSPGLAGAQLNLEPGHAFVLEAQGANPFGKWDPIADIGMVPGAPLGSDPSRDGALVQLPADGTGHSGYLNDGSVSQRSVASVVSGGRFTPGN